MMPGAPASKLAMNEDVITCVIGIVAAHFGWKAGDLSPQTSLIDDLGADSLDRPPGALGPGCVRFVTDLLACVA
jgi:hypothetical protein